MNAKAWRLYAAGDARLEDVELENLTGVSRAP